LQLRVEAQSMGVPLLSAPSGCISPCIRIKDHKARQAIRIKELGAALAADGFVTLDEQARALGLSRSTAWAVLQANHKASGLTVPTIKRMLSSPELPPSARVTILTYIDEKLAGLYGHNKKQLRRFVAFMVEATALTDSDARKDHPTKYAA
jgi:hypothetical protein